MSEGWSFAGENAGWQPEGPANWQPAQQPSESAAGAAAPAGSWRGSAWPATAASAHSPEQWLGSKQRGTCAAGALTTGARATGASCAVECRRPAQHQWEHAAWTLAGQLPAIAAAAGGRLHQSRNDGDELGFRRICQQQLCRRRPRCRRQPAVSCACASCWKLAAGSDTAEAARVECHTWAAAAAAAAAGPLQS